MFRYLYVLTMTLVKCQSVDPNAFQQVHISNSSTTQTTYIEQKKDKYKMHGVKIYPAE